MQVKIVENVWHEGRVLTEGEVHEIADEVAQNLLDSGLVVPAEGGSEGATPLTDGSQAAGDSQAPTEPSDPVEPTTPVDPLTPPTEPATPPAPTVETTSEATQIPVTEPTDPTQPSEPTTATPGATSSQPSPSEIADTLNSIQ